MNMRVQTAAVCALLTLIVQNPVTGQLKNAEVLPEDGNGNPVAGAVYGLYSDEACTKPLLDQDGRERTTDGITLSEQKIREKEVWVKEIRAPDGYYLNEETVRLNKDTVWNCMHEPVRVITEAEEGTVLFLYHGDHAEPDAQWDGEKWIAEEQEYVFTAGEVYTVKTEEKEWTYYPDVTIEIANTVPKQEDIPVIRMEGRVYGTLCIASEDAEGFQLYQDGEGKQEAFDITGEKAAGVKSLNMPEGTWYLKWTGIKDDFWWDEQLYPIEIRKAEETRFEPKFEKVEAEFSASNAVHHEKISSGTWYLRDEAEGTERSFCQTDTPASAALKRNHSYSAVFVPEKGFYPSSQLHLQTGNAKKELKAEAVCMPVLIQAAVFDEETEEMLNGMEFTVSDQSAVLLSFRGSDAVHAENLQPGSSYALSVSGLPADYINPSYRTLTIPGSDEGVQSIFFHAKPFTAFALNKEDAETISLYKDRDCTEKAYDIYGNALTEIAQAYLFSGTYYAVIHNIGEQYYEDDSVKEITIDHSAGNTYVLDWQKQETALCIKAEEEDGTALNGVEFQIREPDGTVIGTWITDNEGIRVNGLKRGKMYIAEILNAPGLYTYERTPASIRIGQKAPDEIPQITMKLNPYFSLAVRAECEESVRIRYTLYRDEEHTLPAQDIHGNAADAETVTEEAAYFLLRSGVYYPAAEVDAEHLLIAEDLPAVDTSVSGWTAGVNVPVRTAGFTFALKNEKDQCTEGALMQLRNAEGEAVYEWITADHEERIAGDFLQKNSEFSIHMIQPPSGYEKQKTSLVFKTAQYYEDADPVLQMQIKEKNSNGSGKSTVETENQGRTVMPEESGRSKRWVIPFAIGVMIIFTFFLKHHFGNRSE